MFKLYKKVLLLSSRLGVKAFHGFKNFRTSMPSSAVGNFRPLLEALAVLSAGHIKLTEKNPCSSLGSKWKRLHHVGNCKCAMGFKTRKIWYENMYLSWIISELYWFLLVFAHFRAKLHRCGLWRVVAALATGPPGDPKTPRGAWSWSR